MLAARVRTLLVAIGSSAAFIVGCGADEGRPPVSDSLAPATGAMIGGGGRSPGVGNDTANENEGNGERADNAAAPPAGNAAPPGAENPAVSTPSVPGFGGTGDFAGRGSPPGFGGSADFGRGTGAYAPTPGGGATTTPATGNSETIVIGP